LSPKKEEKKRNFMLAEFSVGLAGGFSWSLSVLCRGLRKHIQDLLKKKIFFVTKKPFSGSRFSKWMDLDSVNH
jgi:hypothetical protein